ncbi:MAG: SPFH domain-containing protein [Thermoplasmata archaeon]|nr:SPFH domain-containing protein [Thermoplasmata archaeon]
MTDLENLVAALLTIIALTLLLFVMKAVKTVPPFAVGVVTLLGSYRRTIPPGVTFVHPLAQGVTVELRPQEVSIPTPPIATRDGYPALVGAQLGLRVLDAAKSMFQLRD